MERQEKIERLAERMKVTQEEAARALDEAGGDLLDAALLLERFRAAGERVVNTHSTAAAAALSLPEAEGETDQTAASAEDKAKEIVQAVLTGLFTHPILNGVRISYRDKELTTIPAGILLALLLVRWWIVPGLVAVGLMAGWDFAFTGPQWGSAALNAAWKRLEDKVGQWREKMKNGHAQR